MVDFPVQGRAEQANGRKEASLYRIIRPSPSFSQAYGFTKKGCRFEIVVYEDALPRLQDC